MTIKVFVSGICGSHDVRKTQQRVLFILSTLPVDLEIIDVTEPGREQERSLMQEEVRKHNKKDILPPQIFNGDQYCGNYEDFQLAADDDVLMSFLKLEEAPSKNEVITSNTEVKDVSITQNGVNADEDVLEKQNQVGVDDEDTEGIKTGKDSVIDLSADVQNVESVTEGHETNADVNEGKDQTNVEESPSEVAPIAQETEQEVAVPIEQKKPEEEKEESSEEEEESSEEESG